MKPVIEQCIRDWFVAEADTLKLVSPMVTRYRQGGPLEDAHQRLADGIAGKMGSEPFEISAGPAPKTISFYCPKCGEPHDGKTGSCPQCNNPPAKRGPGRPRKNPL